MPPKISLEFQNYLRFCRSKVGIGIAWFVICLGLATAWFYQTEKEYSLLMTLRVGQLQSERKYLAVQPMEIEMALNPFKVRGSLEGNTYVKTFELLPPEPYYDIILYVRSSKNVADASDATKIVDSFRTLFSKPLYEFRARKESALKQAQEQIASNMSGLHKLEKLENRISDLNMVLAAQISRIQLNNELEKLKRKEAELHDLLDPHSMFDTTLISYATTSQNPIYPHLPTFLVFAAFLAIASWVLITLAWYRVREVFVTARPVSV